MEVVASRGAVYYAGEGKARREWIETHHQVVVVSQPHFVASQHMPKVNHHIGHVVPSHAKISLIVRLGAGRRQQYRHYEQRACQLEGRLLSWGKS